MIRVGITGGIGSGKTTICKIFELLDIPVYYSDDRAKYLMNHDPDLKRLIIKEFGEASYISNVLNRAHLASIVFQNKEKLNILNSIVHPAVRNDAHQWALSQKLKPYTLQEAALLFENGAYKHLDYMITVIAPVKIRIDRVIQRDQSNEKEILQRMANQWTDEQRIPLSDFIIQNDGTQSLLQQILQIHRQLIELSLLPIII